MISWTNRWDWKDRKRTTKRKEVRQIEVLFENRRNRKREKDRRNIPFDWFVINHELKTENKKHRLIPGSSLSLFFPFLTFILFFLLSLEKGRKSFCSRFKSGMNGKKPHPEKRPLLLLIHPFPIICIISLFFSLSLYFFLLEVRCLRVISSFRYVLFLWSKRAMRVRK